MITSRLYAICFVAAVAGCSNAGESSRQESATFESSGNAEPRHGQSIQIAAPFRFQFEDSTVEFCASPVTEDAPTCSGQSIRCWLVFDDKANDDLDALTGKTDFETEGLYWMEGSGKKAQSDNGYGHLGQYSCQVKMTRVDRFYLIPVRP